MRKFIYASIAITALSIAFLTGFLFRLQYVHYNQLHNIDIDGSRGRAIIESTSKATFQENYYAAIFGDELGPIWTGPVVKIIDGDTLTVYSRGGGKNERIRLWGIDAPEIGQAYGEDAKQHLESLVSGKRVDVIELGDRDRYGRIVGIIEVDGVCVNELLLIEGMAWVYPKYCAMPLKGIWEALEAYANTHRREVWANFRVGESWE